MEAITTLLSKFRIIFIALLLGQLLFLGVTIFLTLGATQPEDPKEGEIFLFIVPIVLVFGMTAGALISKQRLIQLQKIKELQTRLNGYQQISIIRLALLEGPNLFAIVTFFITQNWILFGMAALGILTFISLFPTRSRLMRELAVRDEELMR